MRGLRLLASWVLALFLIFMFLQATVHPLPNPDEGMVKLFDRPGENIVFQTLADKTGYYWLEPSGRVAIAVLELIACLMLLIPQSRRFGAMLSFVILAGAIYVHLTPDMLGREVPVAIGSDETDGGRLFALSIAMAAVSMLLIFVHPGKRRNPFR